jgi:hypothetical protein
MWKTIIATILSLIVVVTVVAIDSQRPHRALTGAKVQHRMNVRRRKATKALATVSIHSDRLQTAKS